MISSLDATLFRKALALLLAIDNRRATKRTHKDADETDGDDRTTETTDTFKKLSKRFKHDTQAIDEELEKAYERFLPER